MFEPKLSPIDEIFQRLSPVMERVGLKPFAIYSVPTLNSPVEYSYFPIKYSYRMCYIDEKKGGSLPVREECRDDLDFEYKMDAWLARAKVYSPKYSNWEVLVEGETKRLENGQGKN